MRARDAQIVDRLLVEKAKAIAEKMHISDFKASDGWLANFKRRHNIKLQRPHGESGAAHGSDALTVEEYEQLPGEKEVSCSAMQCKAMQLPYAGVACLAL